MDSGAYAQATKAGMKSPRTMNEFLTGKGGHGAISPGEMVFSMKVLFATDPVADGCCQSVYAMV